MQNQLNSNITNQFINPQELSTKNSVILNEDNPPEQKSQNNCLLQRLAIYPNLMQANKEYSDIYHQDSSLYLIKAVNNQTWLFTYDTENEIESSKVLATPELLDRATCIAQLPNGELFCFGAHHSSGTALIISNDFSVQVLPSGTPCCFSSAIYFSRNVYCFGGEDNSSIYLPLSERFDLDKNRWIKLASIPKADKYCQSIVFNGNILISGSENQNILIYSIDIDSFSYIPYEFSYNKRKILVYAEERLYLIECTYGFIYESEIGDEYAWKQVGSSMISFCSQANCWYKGGIHISTVILYTQCILSYRNTYFKFSLDEKRVIELFMN